MHLTIRADGGPEIGFGHLVRTGALAERCLDDDHRVTYLTATEEFARVICPDAVNIATVSGADARAEVTGWIARHEPDVVVTDSYEVDEGYQRAIAAVSRHLGVVMDDDRYRVHADFLINGNVYAGDLAYQWSGGEPIWCLGAEYLLLRSDIRRLAEEQPPFEDPIERALVTMGGSDIQNRTPDVVRAFDGIDVEVNVIIGPGFQNRDEIVLATEQTNARMEVTETPDDLPRLMRRTDLAVSATGSTVYELLALGTPTIGIPQADNQVPIAEALSERDAICHLPMEAFDSLPARIRELAENAAKRRSLRDTGRALIDSRGTERVYRIVRELAS